jgi:hypothetical protein
LIKARVDQTYGKSKEKDKWANFDQSTGGGFLPEEGDDV